MQGPVWPPLLGRGGLWPLLRASGELAGLGSDDRPPTPPPTAKTYTAHGLPWFDYYAEADAVDGAERLRRLRSVVDMAGQKGDAPVPENEPVTPDVVVQIRRDLSSPEGREGAL